MNNYSSSMDAGLAISALGMGFSLFIMGVSLLISIAMYIAVQYPYYRMAKRQGIDNAWLAFIPYGNLYISLKLSPREFNIFDMFRWEDRTKALWAYLIATGAYLVLSFIPFVSYIAALAYIFVAYAIMWRINYDILMTYRMEQHAMWASIVSIFVPLVMVVFTYIIMNKEPDLGSFSEDSYY